MRRVSLARLSGMFAWIGLTSIGGGRAAYVYEILVDRYHWLTQEEFLPGLTISQLLPGPIVSNLAVFIGQGLRGPWGAAMAWIGVLAPGVAAMLLLSALYVRSGVTPGVDAALRGMGAAVVGLLVVTTGRLARGALGARGGLYLVTLTFLTVGPLRMNAVLVILLIGGLGLWLNRPSGPAGVGQRARPEGKA